MWTMKRRRTGKKPNGIYLQGTVAKIFTGEAKKKNADGVTAAMRMV